MQMAQAGLEADDEQVAIDACEIFIDLIEAPAPVLGPSIPDLVRWCMKVALCTSYDLATREMALQASPAATLLLVAILVDFRESVDFERTRGHGGAVDCLWAFLLFSITCVLLAMARS